LHAVAIELKELLLSWERELDSREGAIITREEGLKAFACALGEVCIERDASRTHTDAIKRDFFSQAHTSSSWSKQLTDLS
jgi:hypothetical protein